jgi:hypothetical protein
LVQKIVAKYESSAEAGEMFRVLNFGLTEIARGIISQAEYCPNPQVWLNALALAAKASGMLRDQIKQQPGVTIIIKEREDQLAVPCGGSPAHLHQDKPKAIPGPMAITK